MTDPPEISRRFDETTLPQTQFVQAHHADQTQQQNLFAKLHVLLRGRYHWAITLAILFGFTGALATFFLVHPTYQCSGLIQVAPTLQRIIYSIEENNPVPMYDAYVKSQAVLLKSRRVIDMAMQSADWKQFDRGLDNKAVKDFMDHLDVSYVSGERDLMVTFTDLDFKAAMAATKAVIDAYEKIQTEQESLSETQRLRVLEERRRDLTNEVRSRRELKLKIATEFGTDDLEKVYDFKLHQVQKLEEVLSEAQLALTQSAAAMGGLDGDKYSTNMSAQEVALIDPRMQRYLADRENFLMQITSLKAHLGSQHHDVIRAQTMVNAVEVNIQNLLDRYRGIRLPTNHDDPSSAQRPRDLSVTSTLDKRKAEVASLKELYETSRAELFDIGRKKLQIDNLETEIQTLQEPLKQTNIRIDQLNVEAPVAGRIHIVSRGDAPLGPSNTRKRLQFTVFAALGGASLGVGVIMLMGLLDRRLKYIEDAFANFSSLKVLGILPRLPDDLADQQQAAIAAHCVHQIRTMMQIGPANQSKQVFTITSTASGTGKTSLAIALGLSFAGTGANTLLIDGDLVGRGLTTRMNAIKRARNKTTLRLQDIIHQNQANPPPEPTPDETEQPINQPSPIQESLSNPTNPNTQNTQDKPPPTEGLLAACRGVPLLQCVSQTGVKGLTVLPTGTSSSNQSASLSPAVIAKIINQARQHYDTILIDTGPIPGSIEGSICSKLADAVVVTITHGDQKPMVAGTITHIHSIGATIAGLVFNRADAQDLANSIYMSTSHERIVRTNGRYKSDAQFEESDLYSFGPIGSAVNTYARSSQLNKKRKNKSQSATPDEDQSNASRPQPPEHSQETSEPH